VRGVRSNQGRTPLSDFRRYQRRPNKFSVCSGVALLGKQSIDVKNEIIRANLRLVVAMT
jgi:hypothetical protein